MPSRYGSFYICYLCFFLFCDKITKKSGRCENGSGKIFGGTRGIAGELGHFVIHHGGRQCVCGMKGCFEQYASATALERMAAEAIRENPESLLATQSHNGGTKAVFAAAEAACPVAEGVLAEYVSYLAEGLCSLNFIFQPQKIVLAGGVAKAGEALLQRLRPLLIRKFDVATSSLQGQSGILGAAMLPVFRGKG